MRHSSAMQGPTPRTTMTSIGMLGTVSKDYTFVATILLCPQLLVIAAIK